MPILVYSAETERSPLDLLVDDLDALERRGGSTLWEKAERYVQGHNELKPLYPGLTRQRLTRAINSDLRARADELGRQLPGPTFLSNARKLGDVWPDIFSFKTKDRDYNMYKVIAVSALPSAEKAALRAWAETESPTQTAVRQRVREAVDARNEIYKPDFELKVSNFWKFSTPHDNGGYGGLHPDVIANILFWFSQPGDVILDPMAGTGLLAKTIEKYRFYRETYEAEGSGPRVVMMSDIVPMRSDIVQADARQNLLFAEAVASLAIVDPPYLTIADEKRYENLGADLDQWIAGLELVIRSTMRCVKAGGLIAVITDDVLRKNGHQPIAYQVTAMLAALGLTPRATIYNHNPNFVYTMGPAMMKAARLARLQCNGCKIIQVASVPPQPVG